METYDCQLFPCKICCQKPQEKDARKIDCSKVASGSSGGSPCGVCATSCSDGSDYNGSLVVDAIAALVFFFFWMMQFWLSMASCIYEGFKFIYNSDRSIQIVAGSVFVVVFGGIVLHGVVGGGRCCQSNHVDLNGQNKAGLFGNGGKGDGGFGSSTWTGNLQNGVKGSVSGKVSVVTGGKVGVSGTEQKLPEAHLKIKFKDRKALSGPVEKTFYLTISDEKKKKLFETSTKFSIPSEEKPALVLTTDPIILENY